MINEINVLSSLQPDEQDLVTAWATPALEMACTKLASLPSNIICKKYFDLTLLIEYWIALHIYYIFTRLRMPPPCSRRDDWVRSKCRLPLGGHVLRLPLPPSVPLLPPHPALLPHHLRCHPAHRHIVASNLVKVYQASPLSP